MTHSRGVCGSASTRCTLPLTTKSNAMLSSSAWANCSATAGGCTRRTRNDGSVPQAILPCNLEGTHMLRGIMTFLFVLSLASLAGAQGQAINGAIEGTVTDDVPVVDVGRIEEGRTLTTAEIKTLPLTSRNPYNFALLQPGVVGFETQEFGVPRLTANGALLRVNYQIDGNDNTEKDRAGL